MSDIAISHQLTLVRLSSEDDQPMKLNSFRTANNFSKESQDVILALNSSKSIISSQHSCCFLKALNKRSFTSSIHILETAEKVISTSNAGFPVKSSRICPNLQLNKRRFLRILSSRNLVPLASTMTAFLYDPFLSPRRFACFVDPFSTMANPFSNQMAGNFIWSDFRGSMVCFWFIQRY